LTDGDVEYGVEIGDINESADRWCGLTKVEGDRPVPGRIADRDQGAQAGGVDEADLGEVEYEIVTRVVRESRGRRSERSSSVAAISSSPQIASSAQRG